ncbi:conserved exported hypothetical protein [Candidatus Methylobacter favarea]|uniref:YfdX family protein n=1 Tax=Candidatus Methylobacter favarea TaxID=2707345 RepID=A0A8S0YAZ6_9GAMM|nr:YfdX family protein [Candidatus Methylobacter favarea]CAA9892847.1 conserved exported hypothetical protein [Candidatus Methylobacter favarea]
MKKRFHKMAAYTALILFSSIPFTVDALEDVEKKLSPVASLVNKDKNSLTIRRKLLAEKSQLIVTEARDSITGTQQALIDLEKKDSKAALSLLQDVSKKLGVILEKNPSLRLVTADIEVDIIDFEGDGNTVKKEIKQADNLLDHGKLQDARQILDGLASEMRITTVSIPLGTYPSAIKKAIALIDAGKANEAAVVLDDVLNTLIEQAEIIPLPLLHAEELLTVASELEHKEDLSKEKSRAEVLKFADAAKENLKLAQLLGYGSKDDYKLLYTAIDEIKETIHSEKSASTWAKIKQTLSDLKNRLTRAIK